MENDQRAEMGARCLGTIDVLHHDANVFQSSPSIHDIFEFQQKQRVDFIELLLNGIYLAIGRLLWQKTD